MSTKPILIDCDPGVDDAIALLLAFASPELEVLGITTVAGNVPLSLTQTNARKICELANRPEARVFAGCPRPLLRSLATAEEVHGQSGLGATHLPDPVMPLQPQHGVDFLIEAIMNADRPITLATLGPLTNLAVALIKQPLIVPRIQEVVLMGGAIAQGNITASAEFNIYVDPHAAEVVFTSGLNLTMIGLDITHQVLTTPERLNQIRAIPTPIGKVAAELLTVYGTYDAEKYGMVGSPLHDPCVIAYLLQPDLFTGEQRFVAIETHSELTLGRTVVDLWQQSLQSPNAKVLQTVNASGVYDLLIDRLAQL